jgi:hypothetical protein
VSEFIRLYLTHGQRWASPKFVAGESYGTTRAALLSEHLLDRQGIALNGVILISTVVSFQALSPSDANEVPYALFLPTYTACAFYHKRLAPELSGDLEKTLREVERWVTDVYTPALHQGDRLGLRRLALRLRRGGFRGRRLVLREGGEHQERGEQPCERAGGSAAGATPLECGPRQRGQFWSAGWARRDDALKSSDIVSRLMEVMRVMGVVLR